MRSTTGQGRSAKIMQLQPLPRGDCNVEPSHRKGGADSTNFLGSYIIKSSVGITRYYMISEAFIRSTTRPSFLALPQKSRCTRNITRPDRLFLAGGAQPPRKKQGKKGATSMTGRCVGQCPTSSSIAKDYHRIEKEGSLARATPSHR